MMSTDRELIDTRQKCQRLTTVLNPTLLFIFRLELFCLGLIFMPEWRNRKYAAVLKTVEETRAGSTPVSGTKS